MRWHVPVTAHSLHDSVGILITGKDVASQSQFFKQHASEVALAIDLNTAFESPLPGSVKGNLTMIQRGL
jgi:hypothetical protein